MKKFLVFFFLMMAMMYCNAVPPRGWVSDPGRARALAKLHRLPVLIVFAGSDWCEDSRAFQQKLAGMPELNRFITGNCVPLYVELEPAGSWSREFRKQLQTTYPFIQFDQGLPLPAIFFTDADFRNLQIREPRLSVAGFQKAIEQSRKKIAEYSEQNADVSNAVEPNASPEKSTAQVRKNVTDKVVASKNVKTLSPAESVPQGWKRGLDADWYVKWEDAAAAADQSGKYIYVLRTGSDWCGWCVKLAKDVLKQSKFKNFARKHLILLYLDSPRRGMPEEQLKYNRAVMKKLGLSGGFPTAGIFDKKGKLIKKRSGYANMDAYLKFLESAVKSAR